MSELTENQRFHLLLADIAMAAAIRGCNSSFTLDGDYTPGTLRDTWLAATSDDGLKKRVMALANAGFASLQGVPAEQITKAATAYGIPVDDTLAQEIAGHFSAKREAVLRYRR
ncbi:head completion/stabilization protein [Xanthobacter agilis]|uniref:Uncharacterized protein n=1 Tax=Xanthobacter agilis TaxID=47492 RepID=A0ABU0LDB3_XANAG|nr:head completion/stabilization protein [Xanthobacter agilis]MDQ0505129.1 hypothetical protein [Xanthobacter agilis]